MKADLLLFNRHVGEAEFQMGIDDGKWGLLDENPDRPTWPFCFIWIKAREKANHPEKYYFQFRLDGYPESAPNACPWDIEKDTSLPGNQWPKGLSLVSKVFNPQWNPNALYAPCDRLAIPGHDNWKTEHPNLYWRSTFKITVYVSFLFRLLNSDDYASS